VWLDLQDNQMTGSLPAVLGEMSQLEGLGLGQNKWGGWLPFRYGTLADLRILDVSDNMLTGTVPSHGMAL
jgi:hypothetical protein